MDDQYLQRRGLASLGPAGGPPTVGKFCRAVSITRSARDKSRCVSRGVRLPGAHDVRRLGLRIAFAAVLAVTAAGCGVSNSKGDGPLMSACGQRLAYANMRGYSTNAIVDISEPSWVPPVVVAVGFTGALVRVSRDCHNGASVSLSFSGPPSVALTQRIPASAEAAHSVAIEVVPIEPGLATISARDASGLVHTIRFDVMHSGYSPPTTPATTLPNLVG